MARAGVAVTERKEFRQRSWSIASCHRQSGAEINGEPLDLARRCVIDGTREQRANGSGELFERMPRRPGIRRLCVARRELHFIVVANDGEGLIQVGRFDLRGLQLGHQRGAAATLARHEVAPRLIPPPLILDVVYSHEARRDLCFDRAFAEQMRTEAVNGAGEESLDVGKRVLDPIPLLGARLLPEAVLERELQASPQFGGCLASEGDGGDVLDTIGAVRNPRGDTPRETVCLAGSRPGLDQEGAVELALDPIADRLIAWDVSHAVATAGTVRAWCYRPLPALPPRARRGRSRRRLRIRTTCRSSRRVRE